MEFALDQKRVTESCIPTYDGEDEENTEESEDR